MAQDQRPNAAAAHHFAPSAALAKIVGGAPLPRTEAMKRVWAYIKKNRLQDRNQKRNINADAALSEVFGGRKVVSMFEMTKFIADHLGSSDHEDPRTEVTRTPETPPDESANYPRRIRGKVKWFNAAKGFGVITPDGGGRDVFVHHTAIQGAGFRSLTERAEVSFEVVQSPKGPMAQRVYLAARVGPNFAKQRTRNEPELATGVIVSESRGVAVRETPQRLIPFLDRVRDETPAGMPPVELPADMRVVTVHFDGPERTDLFRAQLQRAQVQVANREESAVAVVVGENYSTLTGLWNLLKERAGLETRFYSQQMFGAVLRTGRDPYQSEDRRELINAANTHASLRRILKDFGFDWPSPSSLRIPTEFSQPFRKSLSEHMRESSVLTALGYHTGLNARLPEQRRVLLARVFDMKNYKLPRIDSAEYMVTWGDGRSKMRLKRMAEHLAMLIKLNHSRKGMRDAVQDWSGDLGWMKSEYYDRNPLFSSGRAAFLWPHV